jgi:hypothetical protein
VLGTIVGAYFGVQAGAAGREQSEAGGADAEQRAAFYAAQLTPAQRREAMAQQTPPGE